MKRRRVTKKAAPAPVAAKKPHWTKKLSDGYAFDTKTILPSREQLIAAIKPYPAPPGVLPKGAHLAMDEGFQNDVVPWMLNSMMNFAFIEGFTFLGYPFLSQLAQIPEFRLIGETIAKEATRKWIDIQSVSDDDTKSAKIQELNDELKRLNAQNVFRKLSEYDSFMGRSHLFVDTGDIDDRKELMSPIGTGDEFTEKKFGKNFLKALKPVEAVWCYPSRYNSSDPLADNWYRPDTWFVNGKEVHRTRLIPFVAREVPDLFKPAFCFGGLSLSQMAKPTVDNWLKTRKAVNDIITAFSVMVLTTDMSSVMEEGNDGLDKRIGMFNNYRDNRGVFVLNKESETFQNVSAPLGSLDKLQAQAQEHICSISQIPLVKYTGISPSGLNASSEGEIRVFYDNQHAYQESFFGPGLDIIFKMAQINIWGKVDPDLRYVYKPLWELNEQQMAELRKAEAETDHELVDQGALNPREVRQRLADDPESPYGAIDVDDVPEPEAPEPGNVRERIDEDTPGAQAA